METLEEQIVKQTKSAIGKAIQQQLTGHNSPLAKLVEQSVATHAGELQQLINEAFSESLADPEFRVSFKQAMRTQVAKVLAQKSGGEVEKRVNELRSNPETRTHISAALLQLVDDVLAA